MSVYRHPQCNSCSMGDMLVDTETIEHRRLGVKYLSHPPRDHSIPRAVSSEFQTWLLV